MPDPTSPHEEESGRTGVPPSADVRLYKNRASYSLRAALDLFAETPVAHIAFLHPGDAQLETDGPAAGRERRGETLMNVPMITVIAPIPPEDGVESDEDEQDSYAVYLHSHRHSGLVEAVLGGRGRVTATTTKIDGVVFSPVAQDHSLNYRSATLHLAHGTVLDDTTAHEEKRSALAAVINTVTGYDRTALIGPADDANTRRTTVIRFRIEKVSCKQRLGGWNSLQEPEVVTPAGHEHDAFTGVVPCWTQWGEPIGYGHGVEEVKKVLAERTAQRELFATKSAWADEDARIESLGKRRQAR